MGKINRKKQLDAGAYGASCRKSNECRDDLICARICRKLFVEGETCQSNDQCEGTLLCSRYTHQCTKPQKISTISKCLSVVFSTKWCLIFTVRRRLCRKARPMQCWFVL